MITTTIDLKIKKRLQELLITKIKTTGTLVEQNQTQGCSFCFEGLIGLAIGGVAYEQRKSIVINNSEQSGFLDKELYKDLLPISISSKLILDNSHILNLTKYQIKYLTNHYIEYPTVKWRYLNDTYKFTFKQFFILLDLI